MSRQKKGPIGSDPTRPVPKSGKSTTVNIVPDDLVVKHGRCNGCFFLFPIEKLVLDPERGLLCDDCRRIKLSTVSFNEEGLCSARA
jgi:hypothetical protein